MSLITLALMDPEWQKLGQRAVEESLAARKLRTGSSVASQKEHVDDVMRRLEELEEACYGKSMGPRRVK